MAFSLVPFADDESLCYEHRAVTVKENQLNCHRQTTVNFINNRFALLCIWMLIRAERQMGKETCEIHRPLWLLVQPLLGFDPFEERHKSRWTFSVRAVSVCGVFHTERVKEAGYKLNIAIINEVCLPEAETCCTVDSVAVSFRPLSCTKTVCSSHWNYKWENYLICEILFFLS